ncbi:MAG: 2OG-Fe(II) oxygenase [Thermoanaerobaculia bacterium]|nr:2OG-Fe(II) oxygenase [Thermoanaerobaculia bacterium]
MIRRSEEMSKPTVHATAPLASCSDLPRVQTTEIVDDLADRGFTIRRGLFDEDYLRALTAEARDAWPDGEFGQAGISRGVDLGTEIRAGHVLCLDPAAPTALQRRYLDFIGDIRHQLARELFLPLHGFEARFAIYPAGACYARHLDQFQQQPHRLVSCLLYLNEDWQGHDGGELCIFEPPDEDGEENEILVLPEFGTFVAFLSDRIEHEVRPTHRERLSLAGWLRRE